MCIHELKTIWVTMIEIDESLPHNMIKKNNNLKNTNKRTQTPTKINEKSKIYIIECRWLSVEEIHGASDFPINILSVLCQPTLCKDLKAVEKKTFFV